MRTHGNTGYCARSLNDRPAATFKYTRYSKFVMAPRCQALVAFDNCGSWCSVSRIGAAGEDGDDDGDEDSTSHSASKTRSRSSVSRKTRNQVPSCDTRLWRLRRDSLDTTLYTISIATSWPALRLRSTPATRSCS